MKRTQIFLLATVSALGMAFGVYSCSTRQAEEALKKPEVQKNGKRLSQNEPTQANQSDPWTHKESQPAGWPKAGTLSDAQQAGLDLAAERRKARQFVDSLNRTWNQLRNQGALSAEPQTPEEFLADNAVEVAKIRAHAAMEVVYGSPNQNSDASTPPPAFASAGPFRLRTVE